MEKISWIRQALRVFDRLKMLDIEGVFSALVEAIRKDIRDFSESVEGEMDCFWRKRGFVFE